MATYYWVGGSGNWDATTTTNWASSSGGAGGAGVPTSVDDVIFDAGSNTGTNPFTVTVTGTSSAPAVCNDFSTGGAGGALDGAMTLSLGATAVLDCYGSLTLPATNFTWSGTNGAVLNFRATTTGKSITTNGVSITLTQLRFDGVGGEWILGSALTLTVNTSASIDLLRGTFRTGNYNITSSSGGIRLNATGDARAMYLGSSTITLANTSAVWNTQSPTTNLTFDAGTSTITTATASPTFTGGGLTFYNVSFTSAASGTTTINGANTFNNLSQTSRSATGLRSVTFSANQTINGTLTLGAANTAIRRVRVFSDVVGTPRTITLNGTLAALADVDFRDIVAAGTVATPWTGTRLGNCLGNSNITFDASKTVYWNLAAGGNWSATGWALSSGGGVDVNNFPLAQDTAIIEDTGLNAAASITIDTLWNLGTVDCSTRTLAATLVQSSTGPQIYGDFILSSSTNYNEVASGSGTLNFVGQGVIQNITSAGTTITVRLAVNSATGTFKLADNLYADEDSISAFQLISGNLDLNGNTLKVGQRFTSSGTLTRSILFNGGKIVLEGKTQTAWTCSDMTNFSYTGNPIVECNFAVGGLASNQISSGTTAGATQSNAPTFKILSGTAVNFRGSAKDLDLTGFTGTFDTSGAQPIVYGDITLGAGMTYANGSNSLYLSASSGTQQITSNGVTIDSDVQMFNSATTRQFMDALTLGATRTLTCAGTVIFAAGTTNTAGTFVFNGTSSDPITLESDTPGSQFTLSQASGTVNATNTTITDSNATGGATFNAFVDQGNIDAGNNDGWDFGISPIVGSYEYTYQLRSFTQPRRF
jgi:hypothetical protein